tara:strand:+ start:131 stop:544 length:414 start_codon:yes stop_codon:yes gene_type:complete
MSKYLFIILILVAGCSNILINDEIPLYLYMEDNIQNNRMLDENDYWWVEYTGYRYTDVLYKTYSQKYVNWETPDSFYVQHMNRIYPTPIITSQTLSRKDGTGKQMIYIDETFIGDTLTIYGCISENKYCSKLRFIVH